jgi:hypothetical protein
MKKWKNLSGPNNEMIWLKSAPIVAKKIINFSSIVLSTTFLSDKYKNIEKRSENDSKLINE